MSAPQAGPDLCATLLHMERRVWAALVAGDAQADAALLSDRFLGVYGDGFTAKADHVAQLASGPSIAFFELDAARAMDLGERVALLSYRARFRRAATGAEEESMYVSSIWQRDHDGWVNLFSQDTPIQPEA
ncbi:nuclear transport factor 2 family protein [Cognatishimia sp. F0-27]|uniref:nuclear transport factor 2 family protein n=1 Tax=Cognatishimia sp. F0-27 TaxID=2816855 RepID=UPI001D0C991A|nr:nuclear transport factor 2 family protein [Cognatishimia sp. F0-27]MCC1494449.1 nuclear transport factor 2 family protein [Cognatishimia sp. F0-27]